ncbi:unnamed protein product [Macrosiphum euphorbiae]|uniref:BED-type domain-containing protein n=1 Tax=Macrosiphum euphorbiae TaxID=13131 RepID=A0AAV0WVG4_9HEMI|nr:unnamed protein product [Macrosiphum euphorbiae]
MAPPRSKGWICFTKVDSTLAKCKLGSVEVKYCGNTSNLMKHLLKHPNVPKSTQALTKFLKNDSNTQTSLIRL